MSYKHRWSWSRESASHICTEQQYRPECAEAPYWIEQAMRRLCR